MIIETIAVDWRCSGCGNVRRTDVTDVTASVAAFRPANWIIDRGRVRCDQCVLAATRVTVTSPDGTTALHQGEWQSGEAPDPQTRVEQMRERMSGLHAGRSADAPPPVQPARMAPGMGGVSSAAVQQAPATHAAAATTYPPRDQGSTINTRDFRPGGGNIAFVDTRDSEFLGPPKTVAGVPQLTANCIGCNMKIADGTDGNPSEQWRMASNSTFERGHSRCLDKIGR